LLWCSQYIYNRDCSKYSVGRVLYTESILLFLIKNNFRSSTHGIYVVLKFDVLNFVPTAFDALVLVRKCPNMEKIWSFDVGGQ